jgi:hypothetical protein
MEDGRRSIDVPYPGIKKVGNLYNREKIKQAMRYQRM